MYNKGLLARACIAAVTILAGVPSAVVALPISEAAPGREALLFTNGLSMVTLGLFAIYLVGALWHKRS